MPSLTDLFTPSFFMFLGITTLLIALVVVYFENKMREQNHKIISMVSLVSAMTDELNIIRSNISLLNTVNYENIGGSNQNDKIIFTPTTSIPTKTIVSTNLIEVSDDSSDEEEDESEDDQNDSDTTENVNLEDNDDSDSDSDSDSETSESSSEEVIQIIEDNLPNQDIQDLKILKLDSLENSIDFKNEPNLVFENLDNDESQEQENSIFNDNDELNELNELNEANEANEINLISSADLKTINISEFNDLEEYKPSTNDTHETTEIKKLSLNKLRNLVLEKGLSNEVSKLKKNDLLKLLGVE
jgi:hypothetical protein